MMAFYYSDGLEAVYYKGSEEDWSKIEGNDELSGVTKYYYSETKPEAEGNYWHYNEKGEVEVW